MLFTSQVFLLGFLPIVLLLYYVTADRALRQAEVILASLVFYAWWDIRFVPLLVGLTLANWLIVRAWARWRPPLLLELGMALNLAALALFKYANFLGENLAALLNLPFHPWDIVLPLGISFFVFQKLSYLIDLKRGDRHVYGLLDFAMFVTFFPQLIAGPIVRHNEIVPQFAASPRRPEMWENLSRGFVLFLIGALKKVGIADVAGRAADGLFAQAGQAPLNGAAAWAAAAAFGLQIYFDFSGYSDMAIGLGRMFGFSLPFNFDAPYRATSIRDFWRRWHMTLSRFLRDYVYIPMGGNRVPEWRQAANVVATMLLGGLWHGANWTFVAWGGLHGMALAVNSAWDRRGWWFPKPLGWIVTSVFVMACWVLFRAPSFAVAADILRAMGGANGLGSVRIPNAGLLALGAVLALIGPTSQECALRLLKPSLWLAVPAGVAATFALLLVGQGVPRAFVYFQF